MDSKANMKNYSRGDVVAGFEALNNIIDKNDDNVISQFKTTHALIQTFLLVLELKHI